LPDMQGLIVAELGGADVLGAADLVAGLEVEEALPPGDRFDHGRRPPADHAAGQFRPLPERPSSPRASQLECPIHARRPPPRAEANSTPSDDPWLAGLTTSGKPRRSSISSRVSAAPSSRKAVALKAAQSGVGTPAARISCFAATLSMQSAQAATPEPVYGRSR